MIKKTKDYPKLIGDKIQSVLKYNKENPESIAKLIRIEISRGLYNCGSDEISKNVCNELGINPSDAPFTIEAKDNDFYCQLFVFLK